MSQVVVNLRLRGGGERELARARRVKPATEESIRHAWFEMGDDLTREANRKILDKASKRGRVYIIRGAGGRTRRHRASAPGQTHANLSGRLRRSISWKVGGGGSDSFDFGYGVSTTSRNQAPRYAPFVEFGTRFMEPRPSLQNAIDSVGSWSVETNFSDHLKREFE